MNSRDFKRKLTAVFSADVAGYSRLMGDDEAATVKTLGDYKHAMSSMIEQHHGRVVDSPGDNLLAEFESVVDAVQCGVALQKELQTRNEELPENRRMQFRIGINLGDVIEEGERLYGDGVNVAARLEALADPGGLCISKTAFDHIENKLPFSYQFLGRKKVKNIAKPVAAYKVLMEPRVIERDQKDESKTTRADKPSPMLPEKPSIAVLPFLNMSEDKGQEFFSDGLTEEIITALSKTPKLFVIARNSSFAYKGKAVNVQQVSRELGVNYVLEGSVRKSGDRMRITAQLIDVMTGKHLWAERYDRALKDIFALQDEITLRITQALQVKLTEGEQARIYGKGTDNLDAYLKWMQGQDLLIRGNKESNTRARRLFEDAIRLDPDWVQPYVLLGWTYLVESLLGWSSSPESSLDKAIDLGRKSLTLDDSLPGPHGLMSQIYLHKRQHDESIAEAQKAVSLEPGMAFAYTWLGSALLYAGRSHEAVRSLEKAVRLNPFPPAYWLRDLGEAYRLEERYKEAITQFMRAIQTNPFYLESYVSLVCTYTLMGRENDAEAAASEVLRIVPDFSVQNYAKALPYKEESDLDRVIGALQKAGLK